MKYAQLIVALAFVLLAYAPAHAQSSGPGLSIVPRAGVGVPIHYVVGVAAEGHLGSRLRAVAQVERWGFQDDCIGIGPCFDSGTLVDAGVNVNVGSATARLQSYVGSAAGAVWRRDTQADELHRNWTARARAGADWRTGGGVAWRGEAGVVHMFNEPGHGTGPLAYVSVGAVIPLTGRR
jgi:hypothetical protein